jgi:hypothetical protein
VDEALLNPFQLGDQLLAAPDCVVNRVQYCSNPPLFVQRDLRYWNRTENLGIYRLPCRADRGSKDKMLDERAQEPMKEEATVHSTRSGAQPEQLTGDYPAPMFFLDEKAATHPPDTTEDNIAWLQSVGGESSRVVVRYGRHSIWVDDTVTNVLDENEWDAAIDVVARVELGPKGASLNGRRG